MREAVTQHVLVRSGSDAYAFRHALLREAVYADVLPGERARLHAAIARALADTRDLVTGGDAVAAAELAHHWRAAHELDEALAASVVAGRSAARIAAFPEAQRHFEYALDVWDHVDGAEARAGMDRIDLTRCAADAANLAADRERAIALARDAAGLLDADRDPVRAGLVQERLGRYLWLVGREDEAAAACRAGVAMLPAEPPSAERARVVAAEGQLLMLRGHARDAIARCEEALAVARAVGARAEEGHALNTLGACRSGHRRARRRRGLPARGARDRARAEAVRRHRSCLREPGRLHRPGRPDRRSRAARARRRRGRPVAGTRHRLPRDAAERGGAPHASAPGAGTTPSSWRSGALDLRTGGLVDGQRTRDPRPDRGGARRSRRRAGRTRACARDRSRPTLRRCGSRRSTRAPPSSSCQPDAPPRRADLVSRALARSEGQEFPFFTARLHWVGHARGGRARGGRARAVRPSTGEREAQCPGRGPGRPDRRAGRRDVVARHARTRTAPLRGAVRGRADARRARARPDRVGRADRARRCARHPGARRLRSLAPCRSVPRSRATPRRRRAAPRRCRHSGSARRPAAAGGDRRAGPARPRRARRRPRTRSARTTSTSRPASATYCGSSPPDARTARSAPSCS